MFISTVKEPFLEKRINGCKSLLQCLELGYTFHISTPVMLSVLPQKEMMLCLCRESMLRDESSKQTLGMFVFVCNLYILR